MGESLLRKALTITLHEISKKEVRINLLKYISTLAHTTVLAADIYYYIGSETLPSTALSTWKNDEQVQSAKKLFESSNQYMRKYHNSNHSKSCVELGYIEYYHNENINASFNYLERALTDADLEKDVLVYQK